MNSIPLSIPGCDTLLEHFKRQVTNNKNAPFLGTRPQTGKDEKNQPTFGPYEWETFGDVHEKSTYVARAIRKNKLAEPVEGEGKQQRFLGIWAKNRAEWLTTLIALMKSRTVCVGFFDAMGNDAVNFIVNQTEVQTMFVAGEYIDKVLAMKDLGMLTTCNCIVSYDNEFNAEQKAKAEQHGVKLLTYKECLD